MPSDKISDELQAWWTANVESGKVAGPLAIWQAAYARGMHRAAEIDE